MKHVIVLNNSSVFSVDVLKLYQPDVRRFTFILNSASHKIFDRASYGKLVQHVVVTEDWSLTSLQKSIAPLIQNGEDIIIITDVERCIPLLGPLNTFFNVKGDVKGAQEDVMRRYYDKSVMHDMVASADIPTPKSLVWDAPSKDVDVFEVLQSKELFIKPRHGTNSTHVCRIKSRNDWAAWQKNYPQDGSYLIQPFIDMPMYHVDSLVHQGEVRVAFCGEYTFPVATAYEGKHAGSILLPHDHIKARRLLNFNQKVVDALKKGGHVYSGALHMEVFMDDAHLLFLEVGARSPGGPLMHLYQEIMGLDFVTEGLLAQIEDVYAGPLINADDKYGAHFWLGYPIKGGDYVPFWHHMPLLENPFVYENRLKASCEIVPVARIANHAGSLLIHGDDFESVYRDFLKIRGCSL